MSFFTPVLALMNRARYAHKFMLIFAVFMLPYCGLSISKLADVNALLEQSRLEMQGLEAIEKYLPVYRQALELGGLHVVSYARNKDDVKTMLTAQSEAFTRQAQELNAQLTNPLFKDLLSPTADPGQDIDKKKLGNQGLSTQMIVHSRYLHALTGNLSEITSASKLSQDSDPRIYRNINLLLTQLLPMYEVMNNTRTYSGYLAAYGYLESTTRPTIVNHLSALELHSDKSGIKGNEQAIALMAEAAKQAAEAYKRDIIDVYTKSGFFDLEWQDRWKTRYDDALAQVELLEQAKNILLSETADLLQARIDENVRSLALWATLLGLVVMLLIYLFVGFYLSVRQAIRDITGATRRMAEGDLQNRLHTQARDELGDLAQDFNEMQSRVSQLIREVAVFSDSTRSKAQNVSDISSASQDSIQRQARELELIATSMSELVSNVQEVSRNSHVTAEKANLAGDKCREGRTQVEHAVNRINKLFTEMEDSINAITSVERESQEIAKAVDLIKSVAEQTNLLALNAAIEAARAGEQGRGFAVVADEVRSLAIRSHQLTGEIDQTIDRLRVQVSNAVKTIRGSHQSAAQSVEQIDLTASIFEQITGSMDQIIDHNIQIASAAEQQATVVQGVEQNTLEIKNLSEGTAEEAQSTVSISDELAGMTRDLHKLIATFKV
ncbi:methyl-accepting chemotaxis protein [Pseudomonas sp. TTU2014-080ASC]|uniref:methyl-accepting chemotaxis protein n=1 Tax=Pseudomonas sp. TTU2014-080ASC TaxID=1729724 RepID=UPI00071844FF|nr:methyl-accepting chemotaxis protein [Pseudomonas sp. TTU2014-080ASC]KRW58501.1 chemotaxis protein [Pseudomonas sp. TTU2014-080ASC]